MVAITKTRTKSGGSHTSQVSNGIYFNNTGFAMLAKAVSFTTVKDVLTVIRNVPIVKEYISFVSEGGRLGVSPSALALYTLTSPPAGLYAKRTDSPSSVMPPVI
jgi:hypothetical protein